MNRKKWEEYEDLILKEKYPLSSKEDILTSLRERSWSSIQTRAIKCLGLSRNFRGWTSEEIAILYKNYPIGGLNAVKKLLPFRSESAIVSRVSILNIPFIRGNCDLSSLLSLNPISCYWIGLLLADGHFNIKTKRCSLSLSIKDEKTVRDFAQFISTDNIKVYKKEDKYEFISVDFYSKNGIPELCNRFSIQSNKTVNPPDFSVIESNKDLMLSILIGLIDGDGCIYNVKGCKASYMSLMCHDKWYKTYEKFSRFLFDNFKTNEYCPRCIVKIVNKKINNITKKYVRFDIRDNYLLKKIKKDVNRMNLPVMKRKWDKIDLGYVSEREETPLVMSVIKQMLNEGLNKKQIIEKTGWTESRVKWAMKKTGK